MIYEDFGSKEQIRDDYEKNKKRINIFVIIVLNFLV